MSQYSLGSSRIEARGLLSRAHWLGCFVVRAGAVLLRGPRILTPLLFLLAVSLSAGTSASFTEDTAFPTQSVGAGTWIPTLRIEIRDQTDDALYETPPCIEVISDTEAVNVYTSFTDGDLLDTGTYYRGGCVLVPEETGELTIRAIAVHSEYSDWRSEEVRYTFSLEPEEEVASQRSSKQDEEDDEKEEEGVTSESALPATVIDNVLQTPSEAATTEGASGVEGIIHPEEGVVPSLPPETALVAETGEVNSEVVSLSTDLPIPDQGEEVSPEDPLVLGVSEE